ncbi:uncharacterized protein LOC131157665 [Malania oleifera]|uniref:uncharacterized protein LOC131157665 n=1 Tax=Malania oleifera TaxID=397392 RepID=UPI0025AE76D6|nr:uncharacterized protein LOC131157665 [Malania oleifera]
MAKTLFFISLLILLFSHSYGNPNSSLELSPSAHVELNRYGFPIGLLPTNVLGYSLNDTSGAFSVNLDSACKILLPPDNYLATYSKTVRGKIVAGRIAELDGIRVRAFFKWWSITGIRSSGDNLVFEVGMVTAKFPAKNFNESPGCDGQRSAS